MRTSAERQKFYGKRVEVVGVLERRTPNEASVSGQQGAAAPAPYLHVIESNRTPE